MDYEKKYRDLVEAVKELQEANPSDNGIQNWIKDNVPELKESEDERIRKFLIDMLKIDEKCYHKEIAWLEKQKTSEEALQYLRENHSPSQVSDFQAAMNIAVAKAYDKGYNDGLEKHDEKLPVGFYYVNSEGKKFYSDTFKYGDITLHVENQGEQKETLCDKCRKEQPSHSCQDITALGRCALEHQGKQKPVISDDALREGITHFGITQYQIDNWLKKYVELKSKVNLSNKVETKFKVEKGEWYVCTQTFVLRGENIVIKGQTYKSNQNGAIEGENKHLFIDTHDGKASDYFRLWTIQDAKEGDVLVTIDRRPFIYKGCLDSKHPNSPVAYCGIDSKNVFFICESKTNWWTDLKVQPATKEQRELLFQKMEEAGYEWDADKKELKKIEQKTWSEDDEYQLTTILHELDLKRELYKKEGNKVEEERYNGQYNWLKSLRPQPKQEWSEEDINMIDWLIRCCEKEHKELCNDKYGHQDIVSDLKRDCRKKWDWLESLKNRVAPQKQWKPSDEQMDTLETAISSLQSTALESLYNELKKL